MAAQAENAIQALDMLQQYRPDILITDIRMPGMDGLELIKNAKKICPELEIIIISGYAHFEYARNALSLGVGNYLLKPIKQDELNETLRKLVSGWMQRNLPRVWKWLSGESVRAM